MRNYPLEVQEERDEGSGPIIGYFSRGHHSAHRFEAAVREHTAEAFNYPRHLFWRIVPQCGVKWVHESAPGRGAFPVTHVSLIW